MARVAEKTRQRLLEAAITLFAERGYADTTVQDIVAAAEANIAAVNYHFGSKDRLYVEALRHSKQQSRLGVPGLPGLDPEQSILGFVDGFLGQLTGHGPARTYVQLVMREMMKPTSALDELVETEIRPGFRRLVEAIELYAAGGLSAARAEMCAMSVVTQCVFFHQNREVVLRLLQRDHYTKPLVAAWREHVRGAVLAIIQTALQAEAEVAAAPRL